MSSSFNAEATAATALAPSTFLEALEPRLAPAGIITATFTNGVLTLTGDAADNGLVITQTAPDTVHIDGYEGTLIKLNGAAPVGAIDLTSAIKSLSADFKGGADHLITNALAVTGNFTVNLGEGDGNSLESGNLSVGGAFKVTGGSGLDGVNCTGLTVSGATTFALGAGINETFLLSSDATPAITLGKGFSYTGGAGSDTVNLSATDGGIHIGGGLTINAGAGPASVIIDTSSVLGITGSLSISSGAHSGGDAVTVMISAPVIDIGGSVTIRNGPGPLAFSLATPGSGTVHVGGSFSLTNSADATESAVDIHSSATVIGGSFSLALGNGSTVANIDGGEPYVPVGSFIVGGSFSLSHGTGGPSTDQVAFAELSIGGRLSASSGAGLVSHSFVAGRLHALGGIAISHAANIDPASANQATFTGFTVKELITPSLTIGNGNGSYANTLYVNEALISGGVSIRHGNASANGLNLTEVGGSWDIGGSLEYSSGVVNHSFVIYAGPHFRVAKDLKVTGGNNTGFELGGGFGITGGAVEIGGDLTVRIGNGANNISLIAESLTVGDDMGLYLGDSAAGRTTYIETGGAMHIGGDFNLRTGAGEVSIVLGGSFVDIAGSATLTTGAYSTGDQGANNFVIGSNDLSIHGPLLINNSAGGPTRTLVYVGHLHLGDGLTVLHGSGFDFFEMISNNTEIQGNFTLRNGAGPTETHLQAARLNLNGSLIVTSATGDDTLTVSAPGFIAGGIAASFGVSDSVSVSLAGDLITGGDFLAVAGPISLSASANASKVLSLAKMTVQSAFSFSGGSDEDWLTLFNTSFAGPVNVNLLAGRDTVDINSTTFRGAFTLAGGDGDDTLSITVEDGIPPTQFLGPVTVRLGDGDDTLFILESAAPTRFYSRTTFDGGSGTDTLNLTLSPTPTGSETVFIGGLPVVTGFEIP